MQTTIPEMRNRAARLGRMTTIFAVVIVLLFAASLASTLISRASEPVSDLRAYYAGAVRLQAGLPLYDTQTDFLANPFLYSYPPPVALLLLPFASYTAAWWFWAALTLVCWLAALWLLLRELGPALRQRIAPIWWPVLLAALINFTPVLSHFFWGQTQLPLLLLLVGSWLALKRGHDSLAGALLGVAIAVKLFPALLVVPLLAQRRWRCLLATGLASVAVLAMSYLLVGWQQASVYFFEMMPRYSSTVVAISTSHTSIQSLLRNAGLAQPWADWLALLARAAIMVVVALAAWRSHDSALAFALGITTLMLVTPVVWEHYFVLAYLPLLVMLARASTRTLALTVLAYFLLAAASLVYHAPPGTLALAQLLPISGTLLLLGLLAQACWGSRDRRHETRDRRSET